jgi:hypothetical protein
MEALRHCAPVDRTLWRLVRRDVRQTDSETIATTIHLTRARLPDSMITQSGTGV